jgi:hypothetical protein
MNASLEAKVLGLCQKAELAYEMALAGPARRFTFEIAKGSAFANVSRSIIAVPGFELPWDCRVKHTENVRNWRAREDETGHSYVIVAAI